MFQPCYWEGMPFVMHNWKQGGYLNSNEPKNMDSKAVLQAIEAYCTQYQARLSYPSPGRFITFTTLAKASSAAELLYITKILQNFWLTLIISLLNKSWSCLKGNC